MKKAIQIFSIIVMLLLSVAAVPRATNIYIDWWAIGPGSYSVSSGNLDSIGMTGQAVVFDVSEGAFDLYSGYLYIFLSKLLDWIYLPLILK